MRVTEPVDIAWAYTCVLLELEPANTMTFTLDVPAVFVPSTVGLVESKSLVASLLVMVMVSLPAGAAVARLTLMVVSRLSPTVTLLKLIFGAVMVSQRSFDRILGLVVNPGGEAGMW